MLGPGRKLNARAHDLKEQLQGATQVACDMPTLTRLIADRTDDYEPPENPLDWQKVSLGTICGIKIVLDSSLKEGEMMICSSKE